MRFSTKAIHAGQEPDPATGAIMTPVYLTATYVQDAPGKNKGYEYSRTANPTRMALEKNLAALEEGKFGLAFSSGCGAESTVLNLLKPGDHVISCADLYGGSYRLFTKVFSNFNIEFSFFDTTNLDGLEKAIKPNTKILWLESPSNPLLRITDLHRASEIAHKYKLIVVVDNTFASPYLQQPLTLGADIVVHSTTKYIGGHSDVVGGAVVTNNQELYERIKFFQNSIGAVPGPMDCFLLLRGTKTLSVRMERHCSNAAKIARFLKEHKEVVRVNYPGLTDFPGHDIAKSQMRDFGGMISMELKGGLERALRFVQSTKLFSLAESLGGVESLLGHPISMTHATLPKEEREKYGLRESLVRLSVGIEDVEDLIDDLAKALDKSLK